MTIINRITAYLRRPTQRQIIAELQRTILSMQFRYDEDLSAYHAEVKRSRAKVERLTNELERVNKLQGHHNACLIGHHATIDRIVQIQEGIIGAKIAFIDTPQPHPADSNVTPFPQRSFANTNTPQGAA